MELKTAYLLLSQLEIGGIDQIREQSSLKRKNRNQRRPIREQSSLIFRISMVLGQFSRIKGTWFPYLCGWARESDDKGTEFP
ncbi:MAG: hypothetical protein A2201_05650 [Alicyclobacillus sp. RIFOXYA1_FULL_53_8]|nr:MAG: hypothetical protein A2201_05650 [Alicyclobacillus sp. RIFOXYA1_FULL_53_8]